MTITVSPLKSDSSQKNKKNQKRHSRIRTYHPSTANLEQKVQRDVRYSFEEMGYKNIGGLMWSSEFGGLPDLKFNSWYEAKGWLQKCDAFREAK